MAKIVEIRLKGPDGQILSVTSVSSVVQFQSVGLGDLVERFAKPIANFIDAASERFLPTDWQTRIGSCGACARRRRKLNLLCPDIECCPVLHQLLGVLSIGLRNRLIAALRQSGRTSRTRML